MKTKDMVKTAILSAVIVACTFISIPTPLGVPYTLQTLGVMLAGFLTDKKRGAVAVLVYLLVGAAGLPVFSSFSGGVGVLTGPTGGFLFGFILLAVFCGAKSHPAIWGVVGVTVCHLLGTCWFAIQTNSGFLYAFYTASLMFLPKDYIMLVAAYFPAKKIKRLYPF